MNAIDSIHLLRRGTAEWNANRPDGTGIDLRHVEIRDVSLSGVNFEKVDFDGARFTSIDLRGANLRQARVNGIKARLARFDDADFSECELKGADFDQVSLSGADLRGVEAFELWIRRSTLRGARFGGSVLRSSHFYNDDLTDVDWADMRPDEVRLKRPLAAESALEFLEQLGCKIDLPNQPTPSDWIDWDRVAVPDPTTSAASILFEGRTYWFTVNRSDYFISYSTADKEIFAAPLAAALRARRQRVWLDDTEIVAADTLETVIRQGIDGANFGVVVLSPSYFARDWTLREWQLLQTKRIFVVLHGLTLMEAITLSPELGTRRMLRSSDGAEVVADQLLEAATRPQGEG